MAEKKEIKFEDKIKKLETIVQELESGEVDLDDAINKYTEAMKLSKECSDKLADVTEKVNKILSENSGADIDKLEKDTDRDNYMSAEEAKKYGLIDKIYAKRQ